MTDSFEKAFEYLKKKLTSYNISSKSKNRIYFQNTGAVGKPLLVFHIAGEMISVQVKYTTQNNKIECPLIMGFPVKNLHQIETIVAINSFLQIAGTMDWQEYADKSSKGRNNLM